MTSEKYWDDRATKRLTEVEKQSNDYIKRVKQIYTRANRDIKKQIANIYKNYSKETGLDIHTLKTLLSKDESDKFWKTLEGKGLKKYVQDNYKARINRLEQLQGQLYARAKEIYGEELETVYGHYRGVINESYNKTIYDTQIGTGYDFSFNKLDDKTINAVLNSKWYGGNYSTRIWGNTNILADRLSKILGGALISGKPYYKTANEVAEIFGVAQYYAERLIRTETNHFNAEAEALAYEELGVEKYVFVATLDNRTSEKCQNHDGKVYDFKDKKTGVNYPPLHPNCRSTTRGYLGEEEEKMLKRRAKNPITGETEIIDNISYNEWKNKYNIDDSNISKPKKEHKKEEKIVISVDDFPKEFLTKKERKNTETIVEFINSQKDANKNVVKLYGSIGKIQKLPFGISHTKNHKLHIRHTPNGISEIKLVIPNISDNKVGQIGTYLHENAHFIDFMISNNDIRKHNGFYSTKKIKLIGILQKRDMTIGNEVQEYFKQYNKMIDDYHDEITKRYRTVFKELNEKFQNGDITYSVYKKQWNTARKNQDYEWSETPREFMGGGVCHFQDIYDALSGGGHSDLNNIRYGHGSKYYRFPKERIKEVFANYSALSIQRPDLIEMLRRDKPELVNTLDEIVVEMLEQI